MPALTSHETTLMVSVLEVKLKLPVSQGSVGVSNNQSAHGVMEALGTFGEHSKV